MFPATRRSVWRRGNAGTSFANTIWVCRSASRATRREPCAGGCGSGLSPSLRLVGYHRAFGDVALSRSAAAAAASADVGGETEGRRSGALGGEDQGLNFSLRLAVREKVPSKIPTPATEPAPT